MDDQHVRQRLSEERARLSSIKADLDASRDESQEDSMQELSSYDQHQADVGTETFDREKDLSILQEVEGELADIEHALQRLDGGTYGVCESCGKAIGEERLEAMPAARFCVADQWQAEREARAPTASEIAE